MLVCVCDIEDEKSDYGKKVSAASFRGHIILFVVKKNTVIEETVSLVATTEVIRA